MAQIWNNWKDASIMFGKARIYLLEVAIGRARRLQFDSWPALAVLDAISIFCRRGFYSNDCSVVLAPILPSPRPQASHNYGLLQAIDLDNFTSTRKRQSLRQARVPVIIGPETESACCRSINRMRVAPVPQTILGKRGASLVCGAKGTD